MPPAVCRALVGRTVEHGLLLRVLERAANGSGAAIGLLGEAGIGKSALARELATAAAAAGMPVLTGRAVLGPGTPPYRPVAEALLGAVRDGTGVADRIRQAPELDAFRDELARLVPGIGPAGGARSPTVEPTVELCDGVLRLLELLAGTTGLLLIQEDLQWADDASLQVLEYLADHLAGRRILLLATGQVDVPVPGIARLRALQARGAVTGVKLHPLTDDGVAELARSVLGTDSPELAAWLQQWSDGIPALVLDLIGTAKDNGLLRAAAGSWQFEVPAADRPVIPEQVAEEVRRALEGLTPQQTEVLRLATVLGREFDARLLPHAAGTESSDVDSLLAALRDLQIVEPWPGGQVTHRFRRALWHGALCTELIGFQAEELAGRALQTVRDVHPDLPGPWCEYAADLAERAGSERVAGSLRTESGRRALQSGAFTRAVTALEGARRHLHDEAVAAERAVVDLLLLQAHVDAGNPARAGEIGGALLGLQQRVGADAAGRISARILLARTAELTGEPDRAAMHLAEARRVADTDRLRLRVDLAAAILEPPPQDASAVARRVLDDPTLDPSDVDAAELCCDARRVLGRALVAHDLRAAELEYQQALAIAEDHRMAHRRYAVLFDLGRIAALTTFRSDAMERLRAGAEDAGARRVTLELDMTLAALRTLRMELADGLEVSQRCEQTARGLGIDTTVHRAIATQAVNHAFARRGEELERCGARLLRQRGVDPATVATLWGARAEYSLGRENRSQALFELDTAMRQLGGRMAGAWPMRGLWVLLRALADADWHSARVTLLAAGWAHTPLIAAHVSYAEAIGRGRRGEPESALRAFTEAEDLIAGLDGTDWLHHRARRLVAEAAVEDGWGDPVSWLRAALDSFARSGHLESATACRSMLRELGVPVPRQRRPVVPDALYQFGITVRELEVLRLIAARLSNAQIGRELFISTRTVEKHVERLLHKTSATSRQELVTWAERILGQSSGSVS